MLETSEILIELHRIVPHTNKFVALKRADWFILRWYCSGSFKAVGALTAKTIQSTTLAFQSVDDVHGGDGLPLGVFGVSDGVTDDVFKEHLEDTSGLLVDQAGDALDTTSAGQTADGGLGDALDVVSQNLAMSFCASLSQSFASLASSGHVAADLLDTN